jgi:hypothetical protein
MTNDWDRDGAEDADDEDEFGPGTTDHDLSEAYGYRLEDSGGGATVPRWLMLAVTLLALAGFLLPTLLLIYRYG